MKRVIKFRVWDKERKGFLHQIDIDSDIIYADTKWYIHGGSALDDNYVMQQYTGLKDKSGTEIYEGDLVDFTWLSGPGSDENETNQEVYWDDGMFNFGRDLMFAMNDTNFLNDTLKVVGHIFEEKAKREVILDELTAQAQELQMGYE